MHVTHNDGSYEPEALRDFRFTRARTSVPKSTNSGAQVALEAVAPCCASKCSDAPIVIAGHGLAGNGTIGDRRTIDGDEVELWARRALGANGFGGDDGAVGNAAVSARTASYTRYHADRAHRSFGLGEIIVAMIDAAGALARRAQLWHWQRRQANATYDALRRLDDRMLHDLGFDRSEMTSVAAEVTGEAEYTRVRAMLTSRRFRSEPISRDHMRESMSTKGNDEGLSKLREWKR